MRAGSQVSAWTFTEHRHIKPILRQLLQLVLDATQCPSRVASEYFRIVETIKDSHDQDLPGLKIALNSLKTRPDFSQCFQSPESLGRRLGRGRPYHMEQTGGVRGASADVRRLKAAEGIQNEKRLATFR